MPAQKEPPCEPYEKLWRGFCVDIELKDEWLERLNAIAGIEVVSTCQGHASGEYPAELFRKAGRAPETGPWVSYIPLHDEPLERLRAIFGDLMVYSEKGCLYRETLRRRPESVQIMALADHCPPETLFHLIPWAPEKVKIEAMMNRSELTEEQFEQWWELVIAGLERLADV